MLLACTGGGGETGAERTGMSMRTADERGERWVIYRPPNDHSTAEDMDENRIPHESESHVPHHDWFLEASPFTDA